jgi:hypothetical protein
MRQCLQKRCYTFSTLPCICRKRKANGTCSSCGRSGKDERSLAAPSRADGIDAPRGSLSHEVISPTYPMRNPLACISCRSAKQKCIHNDAPPCDRCKANGRAERCEFPQPGTSAIHRRPKRPRPSEDVDTASPQAPSAVTATPPRRDDAHVTSGHGGPDAVGTPSSASSVLSRLDPFDLITDEVKNSYLRCAYKWSYHHTPTLLLRIRDRTLEPWLAWALLALAIRYGIFTLAGQLQALIVYQICPEPPSALQEPN